MKKRRIMAVLLALAIGAGALTYAASAKVTPVRITSTWSTVRGGQG